MKKLILVFFVVAAMFLIGGGTLPTDKTPSYNPYRPYPNFAPYPGAVEVLSLSHNTSGTFTPTNRTAMRFVCYSSSGTVNVGATTDSSAAYVNVKYYFNEFTTSAYTMKALKTEMPVLLYLNSRITSVTFVPYSSASHKTCIIQAQ